MLTRDSMLIKDSAPPEIKSIIEHHEAQGMPASGDRNYEGYLSAVREAHKPYWFRFMKKIPPELESTLKNIALDVYRSFHGAESEFKITGNLGRLECHR